MGRFINEFDMKFLEIFVKMGMVEIKKLLFIFNFMGRDDMVLCSNMFLVKFLDVCFNFMVGGIGVKSLVVCMVYVGGWFGFSFCLFWFFVLVVNKFEKELGGWMNFFILMLSCWMLILNGCFEVDVRDFLIRFGFVCVFVWDDSFYFFDII